LSCRYSDIFAECSIFQRYSRRNIYKEESIVPWFAGCGEQPIFIGNLPDKKGNLIGAGDRRDCDG